MIVSRQLEYVCFFPIEFPTKEGDAFIFTAIDVYSKFIFHTGIERANDNEAIIKHVKLLLENKDFKMHRDMGFTLIFHKQLDVLPVIEKIIRPYNGKILVDDLFLTQEYLPVMEHIFKSLSKKPG